MVNAPGLIVSNFTLHNFKCFQSSPFFFWSYLKCDNSKGKRYNNPKTNLWHQILLCPILWIMCVRANKEEQIPSENQLCLKHIHHFRTFLIHMVFLTKFIYVKYWMSFVIRRKFKLCSKYVYRLYSCIYQRRLNTNRKCIFFAINVM